MSDGRHVSTEMMVSGSLPNLADVEDEEKPLIEFSPPRDSKVDDPQKVTSSVTEKSPLKRGNLDLSYNEMNLSQDDIHKDASLRNFLYNENLNSSISSDSISLNLEDVKQGRRSREILRDRTPSTRMSSSRRQDKKSGLEHDKRHLEVSDLNTEGTEPGRKSLDLQYQEIRFSSTDFSNDDMSGKSSRKVSHSSKHRKPIEKKHSNMNSSEPNVSERTDSSNNRNSSVRKHSGTAKTNSQVREDLERYKRSNKKGSNSSVNISSMNSGASRRRSFQRTPNSLDLDRSRIDLTGYNDSSGKRRSFFSVFRSSTDKK